jgi:hypothetical protein
VPGFLADAGGQELVDHHLAGAIDEIDR